MTGERLRIGDTGKDISGDGQRATLVWTMDILYVIVQTSKWMKN
jgi:hypothetical protein